MNALTLRWDQRHRHDLRMGPGRPKLDHGIGVVAAVADRHGRGAQQRVRRFADIFRSRRESVRRLFQLGGGFVELLVELAELHGQLGRTKGTDRSAKIQLLRILADRPEQEQLLRALEDRLVNF